MSNPPASFDQRLALIIGEKAASQSVCNQLVALEAKLAEKSTLERTFVLLAGLEESRDFSAGDARIQQIETLRAEVTDLQAKLTQAELRATGAESTAQAKFDALIVQERATMQDQIARAASDRAVEIMASVGQSVPSSFMPEGRQPKASGKAGDGTGRLAVEEMYRQKYNIS